MDPLIKICINMELCFLSRIFILNVIFVCEFFFTAQHKSDSLSVNPNECKHCKIMTDSFIYWLEKTSRGKFDGGDAAWEEAKLKSYSRSEVRLIEIQEGLCSEVKKHKDQCYSLAEETEQALEKWWFNQEHDVSDIYIWLCIETLKVCCPEKHYGEFCIPCRMDQHSVLCSGNGKCEGDGTRSGNGTCICNKGFAGQDCEKCAENFYSSESGVCRSCHKSCDGCSGPGPSACSVCKSGWTWESGACHDIDECSFLLRCESNQFCVNKESSYDCYACDISCKTCIGPGPSNCSSCDKEAVLWSNTCVDSNLKEKILKSAVQRLLLYTGLIVITLFVYRKSRLLASFVVLIISVYIYFAEKSFTITMLHIISNVYDSIEIY